MKNYTWKENNIILQDNWIKTLINGVNLAHNILTSEILIKRIPGTIMLSYLYYKGKGRKNVIVYIIRMISRILKKRYTEKIQWKIIEVSTINQNAKILGDYIAKEISINPKQYKQVLSNIMKIS